MKVISVTPTQDYKLFVKFNTGCTKTVDVSRLFEYPAFSPLRNQKLFSKVYIDRGRPVWGDKTLDISLNMLSDDFRLPDGHSLFV